MTRPSSVDQVQLQQHINIKQFVLFD
uniref:Uncharacterized protein n=1 Tax=Arundo donax TaxID=35708 RepID=A0A0A8YKH9_ARUDO